MVCVEGNIMTGRLIWLNVFDIYVSFIPMSVYYASFIPVSGCWMLVLMCRVLILVCLLFVFAAI